MKATKIIGRLILGCMLALCLTSKLQAQTNLQFTAVAQTDEQAIRLTWTSTNNEVYEIDEADALAGNADGTTAWNKLYDNYPSQGTNTFWLDTGNYNLTPQILHPKNMPMRFYRIVDKGADTTSDEPSVVITSPSSNTAVSDELTVTVVATTDQPVLSGTKLYVDGQEMQMADSTTNYTDGSGVTNYEADTYSINTCEWGNETHTLFATAECLSSPAGANNGSQSLIGHAVSPFVPVLFSNLVTRISFSQPSFDPSSGQTQQVSAVFAANSDWTLNIVDVYSNVELTATGSGTSMLFNWDGTGTGGANIPNGIYYYYISAQTNGQAYISMVSGIGSSLAVSALAPVSDAENIPMLWGLPPESSGMPLPLAIIPPGYNTNGFILFEASQAELRTLPKTFCQPAPKVKSTKLALSAIGGGFSFQANDASGGSSASSQNCPPSPQRPPSNPIKGFAGTVGIGYQRYLSWTNGYAPTAPLNGIASQHVALQGSGGNNPIKFHDMSTYESEAENFVAAANHYGLNTTLNKVDDQLNISDLKGSGTPFNNVNLGVLMLHGTYGSGNGGLDYTAGICFQMYFPIAAGGGATYLRMSEMNLGGAGTNGLKWMAIMACFSLYHTDWSSMQSRSTYPYNSNLHLLLGCDTTEYTDPNLMAYWVKYMAFGSSTNYSPMTIRAAWYQAATDAYFRSHIQYATSPLIFAVAGDAACSGDMLQTNYTPSGVQFYDRAQVYPSQ